MYDQISSINAKLDTFVNKTEVNEIVKEAVDAAVSDLKATVHDLTGRCELLELENHKLKEEVKQTSCQEEILELRQENENVVKAVSNQQAYLEP
jgi:regulator of replication initiation timing